MTTPQGPADIAWMAHAEMRGEDPRTVLLSAVADAGAWAGAARPTAAPGTWLRIKLPLLPASVSRMQHDWLDAADPAQLAAHVPALVRAFSSEMMDAEHLSSEPLVDLVVAALAARLGPRGDGPTVVYDPVCGSAGMLLAAAEAVRGQGGDVEAHGQELNAATAYIASTALAVGQVTGSVTVGNCLTSDFGHPEYFDFAVAEPPYGLDWQRDAEEVRRLHAAGQYPGGLPSPSDASLLFVQHLVDRMRPSDDGGGRAVVLTRAAALRAPGGDGVRRWLLDADVLEAVIGLPEGISALAGVRLEALVLTNRKAPARQGKVQLVDLRGAYEDRGAGRLSRRQLRPDALESLTRALSTIKPGPFSRTVEAARFLRRSVLVAPAHALSPQAWRLPLSMADDAESYVSRHVQFPDSSVASEGEVSGCRIDIDDVFGRDAGEVDAWARGQGWPLTRLAAIASNTSYVASASSSERPAGLAAVGEGLRVMLPVEAGHPAVYDEPTDTAPERRFLAFSLCDGVQPEFLVSYLNSRNGMLARRTALEPLGGSASPRTVSKSAVDAFLAALVVPVPAPVTQQRMVEADTAVRAAMLRASRTADELWRTPDRRAELMRKIARPAQDQTLAAWAQELPYPLATALWACEAQRGNEHAMQRQLFLFWEATAAFTGTVLLSALDQDQSLRESEMASIRTTLADQGLTMQRATLGVWQVLTQRLGSRFRAMISSDDQDEPARVEALFAGAPDDLVAALCGKDHANLLSAVIKRRNDWNAHGGASSDHVLAEQNRWLVEQIDTLRTFVNGAWADAPLVRAGSASYEDGVFVHDVERVMGLNTPFLKQQITVADPMTRGQLYIVTDGAQRGLRIEPFVQLRESPATAQYACYFYNRLEGENARLVSYHVGADGEVLEPSPGLTTLVAAFDRTQD